MDAKQLYQELILDHNKKPRNWGKLNDATHRSEGLNPLCGDHIWVAVNLDGDIVGIAFEGESCAICKASASMMTMAVKGKTLPKRRRWWSTSARWRPGKKTRGKRSLSRPADGLRGRQGFAVPSEVRDPAWHTLHAAFGKRRLRPPRARPIRCQDA